MHLFLMKIVYIVKLLINYSTMGYEDIEILWKNFSISLFKFIKSKINSKEDAEDILQEVFIKISNNIDKLEDIKKIKSWVFTITRNMIYDYYKKNNLHLIDLDDNFVYEPEEESYLLEMSSCIDHMIKELPTDYSQALEIVYLEWKSGLELSKKLWISLPWAKSRVQRWRKLLKQMFIDCCKPEFNSSWNIIDFHKEKCGKC